MTSYDWLGEDTFEFLRLLERRDVRYLIIGGVAVNFHGYARTTMDIDIFFEPSESNARKLFKALKDFWGGSVPHVDDEKELLEDEVFFQFGREPNRIDLMSSVPGLSFGKAWADKRVLTLDSDPSIDVYFISMEDLIDAKEAADRPIDRADLEYLREALKQSEDD